MKDWHSRGGYLVASFDRQEAAVLRGLVGQVVDMLRARTDEAPSDELAEMTGMRAGPTTAPHDPVLSRLLPDFHRLDPDNPSQQEIDSAAALRSLHEPELIDAKLEVAGVVRESLPSGGGKVKLSYEQADAWITAINDVRLALGTALDVDEGTPEELPADDSRASHLGVYHWLTYVQEGLIQAMSA